MTRDPPSRLPGTITDNELGFASRLLRQGCIQEIAPLPDGWRPGADPATQGNRPDLRYADLGPIASGGMGTVHRVHDRVLDRVIAIKLIHPQWLDNADSFLRFIDEAQITAQLTHPAIVPVHDLGQLADGRIYFTMHEVRGRTLTKVIRAVHLASTSTRWGKTADGWTFTRLISTFLTICEAMAYAHDRGVIHRDLKPGNIMVGDYGEELVLDWGVGRVLAAVERASRAVEGPVRTVRSAGAWQSTLHGSLVGTPNYMPPEQARGQLDELGPHSDVYALGAVLYQLLRGRPPYRSKDWKEVVRMVLAGPPTQPVASPQGGAGQASVVFADKVQSPPIPEALWRICATAMSRDPDERYPDARGLAEAIEQWQEGERRREEALEMVQRARAIAPSLAQRRADVEKARRQAAELLATVHPYDPAERKSEIWHLEDHAEALAIEAALREAEVTQLLQSAMVRAPDLREAQDELADHYRDLHARAEADRDKLGAARYEALLRAQDSGRHARYLAGNGALTLHTVPEGARATIHLYALRGRRLIAAPAGPPRHTPLVRHPLPMGSYLVRVEAPGHAPMAYPVCISRNGEWDGVAPGGTAPEVIPLAPDTLVGPDDCTVPAGWAWTGGDPAAIRPLPRRRVWVDAFVMRRFPVTNGEYVAFLNDLVRRGRVREALTLAPHDRPARPGEPGRILFRRGPDGRFVIELGVDPWRAEHPVVLVDWHGARAYAAWLADRDGVPWRLPCELEWEKAARGVDGRFFPWGDHADPTWCSNREATATRPRLQVVQSFPTDVSPYGVRGLAGNVAEWCIDRFRTEGPNVVEDRLVVPQQPEAPDEHVNRTTKGGFWSGGIAVARAAYRYMFPAESVMDTLGFRVARSVDAAAWR